MRTVGDWQIDPDRGLLRRGEVEVRLRPRAMDVLMYLVERPGKLVRKDELLEAFWRGTFESDNAVSKVISDLRKAFEDPSYIENRHGVGYVLRAPVDKQAATDPAPLEEAPRSAVAGRPSALIAEDDPNDRNTAGVFICYSHTDSALVLPEVQWLQDQGINTWFDEGVKPGAEWSETLAYRIESCSHFLYFITPNSVVSEHCRRELNFAQEEGKHVLAVELVPTRVPSGLRLSLNNRQIIRKHGLSDTDYRGRLGLGIGSDPVSTGPTILSSRSRRRAVRFAAAMILAVVFGLIAYFQSSQQQQSEYVNPRSVAILPFENLSSDPELDGLGRAISADLINSLGQWQTPSVAPNSTTFSLADQGMGANEIVAALNVGYVIEGSVHKVGDNVRINAQLIRAVDGVSIWTQQYDRFLDKVFDEYDSIPKTIAYAARVWLLSDAQSRDRSQFETSSDEAAYYLQLGQKEYQRLVNGQGGSWPQITQYYEKAVELDPDFIVAYMLVSNAYMSRAGWDVPIVEASRRARAAIEHCLELAVSYPDFLRAECLAQRAQIEHRVDLDYTAAERTLEEVLAINPSQRFAPAVLAWVKASQGDRTSALELEGIARGMDNEAETMLILLGIARQYQALGAYQEAYETHRDVLKIIQDKRLRAYTMRQLARSAVRLGNMTDASEWLDAAWEIAGDIEPHVFVDLLVATGQRERADQLFAQWRSRGAPHVPFMYRYDVNYFEELRTYLAMGDLDHAFALLRDGIDNREYRMAFDLRVDALFDPYRNDPRFQAVMDYLEQQEAGGITISSQPDIVPNPPPTLAISPFDVSEGTPGQYATVDESMMAEFGNTALLRLVRADAQSPAATYLVEGTARVLDEHVRTSVHLYYQPEASMIWSTTIDQPVGSAPRAEHFAYMIRAMAGLHFGVHVGGGGTESEAARHYFWIAQRNWTAIMLGTGGDWQTVVQYLQRAIQVDPEYVAAYAALAQAYAIRLGFTVSAREAGPLAHEAIEKAMQLAPRDPFVLLVSGQVNLDLDLDYASALSRMSEAKAAGFSLGSVEEQKGRVYLAMGDPATALKSARTAFQSDVSRGTPWVHFFQGQALLSMGQYGEASEAIDDGLKFVGPVGMAPQTGQVLKVFACHLGGSDCAKDAMDQAVAAYQSGGLNLLPGALALVGRTDEARKHLQQMEKDVAAGRHVFATGAFQGYFFLGEMDKAFEWLDRAIDNREHYFFAQMRVAPHFARLREDPRFDLAMRKLARTENGGTAATETPRVLSNEPSTDAGSSLPRCSDQTIGGSADCVSSAAIGVSRG